MANELYQLGSSAVLYLWATPVTGWATDPSGSITVAEGDFATAVAMGNVTNVTVNMESNEASISARDSGSWEASAATTKRGSLDFEMIWRPGDTALAAIRNAFLSNVPSEKVVWLAPLTASYNDVDGLAEGMVAGFTVSSFPREEQLAEVIKHRVSMKIAKYVNWYTNAT